MLSKPQLSVIVPVLNEAASLRWFHNELCRVLDRLSMGYEVVYVDDGSTDGSREFLQQLAQGNIRLVVLTRHVGKEIALSAGLREARGQAMLMIDADGQHPVEAIPKFVQEWRKGAHVVVGRRTKRRADITKRLGSRLFYGFFSKVFRVKIDQDSSDFRLISRVVCDQFNRLGEHNRMARSLIDWFGYDYTIVEYVENDRREGISPYTFQKLMKLAIDSAISHSTSPLYFAAFAGSGILLLSLLLGIGMLVNVVLGDPLGLHATASAYVLVLVLFLIGLLLISQGIIGLYLAHIHAETQGRPLYVIDEKESRL